MKHQSSTIAHPPWWSHQWSTREWRGLSSSSEPSAGAAPETTHNKDGLVLNSSATLAAVLFNLTLGLQCVYACVLVWMQHISGPLVSPGWSTDQHGKLLCCLVLVALLCQERLEEHQPQIISTNKAVSSFDFLQVYSTCVDDSSLSYKYNLIKIADFNKFSVKYCRIYAGD